MQLFYHLMNGLGNRFLIFDARAALLDLQDESVIPQLANRYDIDQLILLGPGSKEEKSGEFDTKMLVWNRDGSRVDACGNAARCVGWLLTEESGEDCTKIKSGSRLQIARRVGAYEIEVDMGSPRLRWQDIPLNGDMIDQNSSTRVIELQVGPIDLPIISRPGCVSMGNPHCVFLLRILRAWTLLPWGLCLSIILFFRKGPILDLLKFWLRIRSGCAFGSAARASQKPVVPAHVLLWLLRIGADLLAGRRSCCLTADSYLSNGRQKPIM